MTEGDLPRKVHEHVEATAVRHANHHFLNFRDPTVLE